MRYHFPKLKSPPFMPASHQATPIACRVTGPAVSSFSRAAAAPHGRRLSLTRQLLTWLAVLLLASCGYAPTAPEAPPQPPAAGPDATQYFEDGQYAAAAAAWEEQAESAAPGQASSLRVRAADAWLLAGDPADGHRALRRVSRQELDAADQARLDLVLADLALRADRPDEAETLLQQAAGTLPATSQARYRSLQEQLRQKTLGPVSRELGDAHQLVAAMRAYNPVAAVDLMRTLEGVSSAELAIRSENPRADRQWVGWLDLALVIRQNLVVPDRVESAITGWKQRYPQHLLSANEALDTWLRYRETFKPPRMTAVLLPDSGRLRGAGEAIRDGLLTAFYARPSGGELQFFATGDDTDSAIAAYYSALDAGADQLVGPLRKEAVEALLGLPGLTTPVLALNDLPADFLAPPGLAGQITGLSLSQEAEVTALAARAAAAGYQRAIVLAPENEWGERMAAVFEAEFLRDGQQIIASARYVDEENDHSATLERLLQVDESKARAQQLRNILQLPIEYEPVRRSDVDVIFLAATPPQARLIRPQLRFLDAGDVPVYATGRVYSGVPDPGRNQDLDGVLFPTTPWEIAHGEPGAMPDLASLRGGSLASLFALGQDAWNLLSFMRLLRQDPGYVYPGQSGQYRVPIGGGPQREPGWAEFEQGRPRPAVPVDG